MTNTPSDGEPPQDPASQPSGGSSEPGYWEKQAQPEQPSGQPGHGQQPPPYGQPAYQQPQNGAPPYQQPQYGQPEYGQPPYGQGYPPYQAAPPNHGGALASMIVGIVALVLACGYGVTLLASPVAWVLGSKAMKDIDASQGQLGGRGMAKAGLILGIVGTVLLVLLIAVVAAVVIYAANTSGETDF